MEDNTLQGLLRLIESRESSLYKLEGMGHWYILSFLKPAELKIFEVIAGSAYLDAVDDFFDAECYRLDYEGVDPDLDIKFFGKIHGIKFTIETDYDSSSELDYFHFYACRQEPCMGCGDDYFSRSLKLSAIEVKDLPLYIQNVSETFEKILKEGEINKSAYSKPAWDTEPEEDPDTEEES
jgi:hypothetical protein